MHHDKSIEKKFISKNDYHIHFIWQVFWSQAKNTTQFYFAESLELHYKLTENYFKHNYNNEVATRKI